MEPRIVVYIMILDRFLLHGQENCIRINLPDLMWMALCMLLTAVLSSCSKEHNPECCFLANLDSHLRLPAAYHCKKVYHVDQELYILSATIRKVLFERKPLGELFVKPKRPLNDSDYGQLTL